MSATLKGIAASVIFHGFLGISLLALDTITAGKKKPFKLDIYFSYDYVPKGNSLDESLLTEEKTEKVIRKRNKTVPSVKRDHSGRDNEEKKYGEADGDENADSTYVKQNLARIRACIRNIIKYPPIARRMGWGGKADIIFYLSTEGKIYNVTVKKSSGFPVLDKCAIKAVQSLTGLPKPPVLTRVNVPFTFSLR